MTGAANLLDGDRIRARRLSLGISERELARRLGVTGVVVNNLERGLNHADQDAGLLADLARHLGLPIADLFTAPPATQAEDGAAGDAAAVGALVAAAGRGVPATVLADATGWTLDRVTAALDELEVRLSAVGQALLRFGDGEVKLVPRVGAGDRDRLQAMLRRSFARTGMNLRQASMLHRVMRGQATGAEQRNSDRVALAELVNAGLVEWPAERASRPRLSSDASDGLGAGS
jgi:transcriptional regulator with XRE-family HTH domain